MADPFDVLALPAVAVAPRATFRDELRGRVAASLAGGPDPGSPTSSWTGRPSIVPGLSVRGAAAAIRWYIDVLGAEPDGDPIMDDDGRVGHMELRFGGATVSLADEYPELGILSPLSRGGTTVQLALVVDDVGATFARAVDAGATTLREPAEEFYGARSGMIRDPWGHDWHLQQPIEDVGPSDWADRLAGTEYGVRPLDEVAVPTVDLGERASPAIEDHGSARPSKRPGDLGYFTLDVADPDITADFFAALLGWEVRQGALEEGRHMAGIVPPGGISGGHDGVGITAYFRVDDLDAAAGRVRELGGEVLSTAEYPSGATASCRDPQGLPFQLWLPAPGY